MTESRGKPVLVSACLLGRRCRYDGRHNADGRLLRTLEQRGEDPVPFCPEEEGGLGTPRPPAWIAEGGAGAVLDGAARVVTESGADVTAEFLAGAERARAACRDAGVQRAYLKERSPSCGVSCTHVGGRSVEGRGVTAERLFRSGVEVVGVEGRSR